MSSLNYKKTFTSGIKDGMTITVTLSFINEHEALSFYKNLLTKQLKKGFLTERMTRAKFYVHSPVVV